MAGSEVLFSGSATAIGNLRSFGDATAGKVCGKDNIPLASSDILEIRRRGRIRQFFHVDKRSIYYKIILSRRKVRNYRLQAWSILSRNINNMFQMLYLFISIFIR